MKVKELIERLKDCPNADLTFSIDVGDDPHSRIFLDNAEILKCKTDPANQFSSIYEIVILLVEK